MDGSDATSQLTAEAQLFPWWLFLLWGILTLLIGLAFLFTPAITTELFIIFLAAYWLVGGLFMLGSLLASRANTGMKILLGVINVFAGILILSHPVFATIFALSFIVIFLGFWACFIGAVHLYHAIGAKDLGNGVLGIISIVFGILLLVKPFDVAAILPFVAGGFCVVSGFSMGYVAFLLKHAPA